VSAAPAAERNRQIDLSVLWRVEEHRRSDENRPLGIEGLHDQIGGAALPVKELLSGVLNTIGTIPIGLVIAQQLLATQVPIESEYPDAGRGETVREPNMACNSEVSRLPRLIGRQSVHGRSPSGPVSVLFCLCP
jgi:hypothetical protein